MKMMKGMVAALLVLVFGFSAPQGDFKSEQKHYSRVRAAYSEKETRMAELLEKQGLKASSFELYVRAFKQEELVQLWGRASGKDQFKLIIEYPFCTTSGNLGPKRKQGDYQIPEGFYHIDRFNAWSTFHLSLGINYPNASDKKLGGSNPGGDIFIHGNCVTIGCIPITDDKIKEMYLLAVEAKNGGQNKIPVHIFPAKMTEQNMQSLKAKYAGKSELLIFWNGLKPGYDHFEQNKTLPKISVASNGNYSIDR